VHYLADEWSHRWEVHMSSAGSQFEEFARDCVRLAGQAKSPELCEKLFAMAREWMRAAMDEQDAPRRTMPEVTTQRTGLNRIEPESAPHKMNPA
jgi:uncharacterized UPF0160 family protein